MVAAVDVGVHQLLLIGLALGLAFIGRRTRTRAGRPAHGRLFAAGVFLAALAAVRLLAALATWGTAPAAALSLAALELGGALWLLDAWRRLRADGALGGGWLAGAGALAAVAAGAAIAAVAAGGGGSGAALASACRALAQGLFLAAPLFWCARLWAREQREDSTACRDLLEAARKERDLAARQRDEARRAAEDVEHTLEGQREQAKLLARRASTVERILQLSAQINATRSLNAVLQQVAEAVRESLGFRVVLVRIWSPSAQVFEARAFAGISEEGKAHLTARQVVMDEYRTMTQPRFRRSQSYFISHMDKDWEEATAGGWTTSLGQRADDEWHEDDMLIVPLLSAGDEVRGYLSVDDPVDRRLPSLEVIRQLEIFASQATTAIESAELYDRLARNNLELSRASQQLQNLNELKSNFVANVSHELRTPLTSIKAYTETLCHNHAAMPEETRREFLEVIHAESEKITAIMNDILDLARGDDPSRRARRTDSDLCQLIRGAVANIEAARAEKSLELRLDLPPESVRLSVDPKQLEQVVEHLLNNAIKFTSSGGSIRVALQDGMTAVRLVVEDSGIGIPENELEQIFDRFYQVDGSSTREHGGQGVGLAICRDIVLWHEGRIWAENLQPRGARLVVSLPRSGEVVHRGVAKESLPSYNDPQEFMEKLMHWIGETVGVRNISLMVPDESGENLVIEAAVGLSESVVQSTRLRRGEGIAGKVWVSGRALLVGDVVADGRFGKRVNAPQYSTPSLLSVPVIDGIECHAVLNVNNRIDGKPFSADERLLIEALAPRIAYLLRRRAAWQAQARELGALRDTMRAAVAVRRERHDSWTDLVQEICMATARRIKLPQEDLEALSLALQVYDLGLVRLSESLLRKAAPLTDEEKELIRHHVHHTLDLLSPLDVPSKVRQLILHHHERFDGGGYPDGLAGEAIPVGARLLALSDALNAILQGRAWRPACRLEQALVEIEKHVGAQFCPRLAAAFLAEAGASARALCAADERVPDAAVSPLPETPPPAGEAVPVSSGVGCGR